MNPLVILLRIFVPLLILRWPLIGGALAIWLDIIDWSTKNLLGFSPFGDYQIVDKMLDIYYLSFLAFVSLRFKNIVIRNLSLGLFLFRFVGFTIFEITQMRQMLFLFPNVFENFFFFYYILRKTASYEPKISFYFLSIIVVLLAIPKIFQEFSAHIIQKPLEINILNLSYLVQDPYHQIAYVFGIAISCGLWYRRIKKEGS